MEGTHLTFLIHLGMCPGMGWGEWVMSVEQVVDAQEEPLSYHGVGPPSPGAQGPLYGS